MEIAKTLALFAASEQTNKIDEEDEEEQNTDRPVAGKQAKVDEMIKPKKE